MNKLTALIEAAKVATPGRWKVGKKRVSLMSKKPMYSVEGPSCVSDWEDWGFTKESAAFIALANPATILELCALLEKAEEALERMCIVTTSGAEGGMLNMGSLEGRTTFYDLLRTEKVTATEALATIKQWKEQT